jgi:hypothetical protein
MRRKNYVSGKQLRDLTIIYDESSKNIDVLLETSKLTKSVSRIISGNRKSVVVCPMKRCKENGDCNDRCRDKA